MAKSQRELSKAQMEASAATQRVVRQQEQIDAERRQRVADGQRAEFDTQRAAQDQIARKDAAWKRFYRPSPGCVEASTSVECANEHIRAKRAFETKFGAGQL